MRFNDRARTEKMSKRWIGLLILVPCLGACATIPTGPSVMVLPGGGKSFEQFQADDALCRQWAQQQTGTTPGAAAAGSTAGGGATGTPGGAGVGAGLGAAIGAAGGHAGAGAAVGAGVGLLGGTAVGASAGQRAGMSAQRRY